MAENKNLTFDSWKDNHEKSGLWAKATGADGTFHGHFTAEQDQFGNVYGSNADQEWLMESWANATDDEINDYIQRLVKEGYSKKELVHIKNELQSNRYVGQYQTLDRFVRKSDTSSSNKFRVVDIDGEQYALLTKGNMGTEAGINLEGFNLKTGQFEQIGEKFFGTGTLNEQYENFQKVISTMTYKTSEELQEIMKNNTQPTEPDISDLDPETLANLTDEEIVEWANSADDYDRAIKLRDDARKKINIDNTANTNTKINDGGERKRRRTTGKKKNSSSNLNKRSIKARKVDSIKQAAASTIVNEAIDAAEETIEAATENTAKAIIEDQHYAKVSMKHPSQMADSELADLSDEEFEQLKSLANGDKKELSNWEARRNKTKAERIYDDLNNGESNYYHSNVENTNPYRYDIPEYDFEVDENGNVKNMNKTGKTNKTIIEDNKTLRRRAMEDSNANPFRRSTGEMDDVFSWMKKHGINAFDVGFNLFGAIGDYKNARRSGHGVVSSLGKATVSFAMGEMLGFWGSIGIATAKGVGKMAVKGTELLYKENRRMNSAANKQAFGNAEFYDTQQLATMRQSGMEMAKMAQYNLQQTLMGNEATYLHR